MQQPLIVMPPTTPQVATSAAANTTATLPSSMYTNAAVLANVFILCLNSTVRGYNVLTKKVTACLVLLILLLF